MSKLKPEIPPVVADHNDHPRGPGVTGRELPVRGKWGVGKTEEVGRAEPEMNRLRTDGKDKNYRGGRHDFEASHSDDPSTQPPPGQPEHRVDGQVICGLVEEEDVRLIDERALKKAEAKDKGNQECAKLIALKRIGLKYATPWSPRCCGLVAQPKDGMNELVWTSAGRQGGQSSQHTG